MQRLVETRPVYSKKAAKNSHTREKHTHTEAGFKISTIELRLLQKVFGVWIAIMQPW